MDVTQRLVERLIASDTPLERSALLDEAGQLLVDEGPLAPETVARDAVDALVGLGPLEALLRDSTVSDVLVNSPNEVWVERAGTLEPTDVAFRDEAAVVAAVERVIAPLGLRLDRASPAVDARLQDGSRLHAVIPPIAVNGPAIAVRRFTRAVRSLDELARAGGVTNEGAELLGSAVRERRNLVVSGGTGTGKTTLLNILSGLIPATERVVIVEDAAELDFDGHVVRLEARPPNAEGAGEIPLRSLLRHALRLRPDRIVVGEVRGAEALDMIQAMSTGHEGSMSTVHANSPEEAMWRIETLALSGDLRVSDATVRRQLYGSVDLVVQVERHHGLRRVGTIASVTQSGTEEVYSC